MIYRVETIHSGAFMDGVRRMLLNYWLLLSDGEVLVRVERALRCDGVWKVEPIGSGSDEDAEVPLQEMLAIIGSQELRELAWREGAVEFAVERNADMGKAEIYVQAKLAL